MSAVANIVMDQGSDFEFQFDVTDADGVALDLSTCTVRAQMRRHHSSANSFSFTASSHANGAVVLTMSAATTAAIEDGYYVYDVESVSSANVVSRVLQGKVRVVPEVTK